MPICKTGLKEIKMKSYFSELGGEKVYIIAGGMSNVYVGVIEEVTDSYVVLSNASWMVSEDEYQHRGDELAIPFNSIEIVYQ